MTEHGTYTPSRTAQWEELVGWSYKEAGGRMMKGQVALYVTFRRKGQRRADIDNMIKSLVDGLNGVAYEDDQQVRRLVADVVYGCDEPGAAITIRRIDD